MGKHIKRFTAMHIKSFSYSFHRPLQKLDQDLDIEHHQDLEPSIDQAQGLDADIDKDLNQDLDLCQDPDIGSEFFRIRFIQDSDHTYKST